MLISNLNRFIQKHGKVAIVIIAVIIIIPFVFMWGPSSGFFQGQSQSGKSVGKIYGRELSYSEYMRHIRAVQLRFYFQMRRWFSMNDQRFGKILKKQALRRFRLLHEARERGLAEVSQSVVNDRLRTMFSSSEGEYSKEKYNEFRNNVLARWQGINEADFVEMVRQNIITKRVQKEVRNSVFVSPQEVTAAMKRQMQSYVVYKKDITVDSSVKKEITPEDISPQEVKDYYGKNIKKFGGYLKEGETPETLKERYGEFKTGKEEESGRFEDISLSVEAFKEKVDKYVKPYFQPSEKKVAVVAFKPKAYRDQVEAVPEDEMRQYYNEHKNQYAPKVHARHILFQLPEDADEETVKEKRDELRKLKEAAQKGGSFEELARRHSEDKRTKKRGGDLGEFRKNTRRPMARAIADKAFELESGDISSPVKTDQGIHLIKVQEKIPEKSFEKVKSEIRRALIQQRASDQAWEAADGFAYDVFEAIDEAKEKKPVEVFRSFAEKRELQVQTTPWFSKEDQNVPPFGNQADAVANAYKLGADQRISQVIEGKNQYFVACWAKTQPGFLPGLDESPGMKSQIRKELLRNKRLESVRKKAKTFVGKLGQKKTSKMDGAVLKKEHGFSKLPSFKREQPPRKQKHGRLIAKEVKDAAEGSLKVANVDNGALVIYLAEKRQPDEQELAEKRSEQRKRLVRKKEQEALQNFYEKLKKESNTELESDAML